MLIQTLSAACLIAALQAPPAHGYHAHTARRRFISVDYARQFIYPMGFAKHPLQDFFGQQIDEVHLQSFQFRTHDQQTQITVPVFGHRGSAIGATIYPFGSSEGPTLALRGSIEKIPDIRAEFAGPAFAPVYTLTNGRAVDLSLGIDVGDRSPGWGLGSHAFLMGGAGRAFADERNGTRYFVEGGGGLSSGPFGVDLSVKYVRNMFTAPLTHVIYMIPVTVRGTLTF
jgi:hypothetical protein